MNIPLSNLKSLCFFVSLISLTSPSYAYLDPGTGSIVIQSIVAGAAITLSFLSIYWQKIKSFFEKKEKSIDSKEEK